MGNMKKILDFLIPQLIKVKNFILKHKIILLLLMLLIASFIIYFFVSNFIGTIIGVFSTLGFVTKIINIKNQINEIDEKINELKINEKELINKHDKKIDNINNDDYDELWDDLQPRKKNREIKK